MERFYITQNGNSVGPWSVDQILSNLKSNSLSWTDYLFDEVKQDWVLLMDHASFVSHFRDMANAPATKPTPVVGIPRSESEQAREKEWFCLRGDNKYGPFTLIEAIKMLQDKNLYEFDFVWNVRFQSWKRVSECEEFQPEKVRALRDSGHLEIEEVFFRRRHVRAQYGASLLVHNSRDVWKAESFEISSGGCGLMVECQTLEPGQSLFLHFKAGDGVPPFNAICEIVSKQTPQAGQHRIKYGVKFTNINRQVQLAIKEFTGRAA